MKTEYDLSIMKRRGHPLRKRLSQGELKLIKIVDIPDIDVKLTALTPDERELVVRLIELSDSNIKT